MFEQQREIEPQFKLIQLKRETFLRLREHNRYYNHDDDDNTISFDDIIVILIDFYENNS
ncbi:MAG TPA: hypothetical protein VK250_01650 [Nitrososphaeraceae archaeon]|nr:hypothetical protein [Nitrososphaeraceae archaeon]